ncbi:MAG: hypothetical protein ACR2H3_12860 [Acidimicrobiales bacterium]
MSRSPSCLWLVSNQLLAAIDERFGDPVDSYVNGSQTWLREEGPDEVVIEWRLHPVASFVRPAGIDTYDLWPNTVIAIARGEPPPTDPKALWEGLEAFPAYGDDIEPAALRALATASLGRPPDAFGLVDHRAVADEWERSGGRTSIVRALLAQLDNV